MRSRDAMEMLADSGVDALGPTIWADLGCGNATFTFALAEVLASGSVIHAMDLDDSGLRRVPLAHKTAAECDENSEVAPESRTVARYGWRARSIWRRLTVAAAAIETICVSRSSTAVARKVSGHSPCPT
jgi:hypothetical protein